MSAMPVIILDHGDLPQAIIKFVSHARREGQVDLEKRQGQHPGLAFSYVEDRESGKGLGHQQERSPSRVV
jgi:hypothetical protein